MTTWQPQEARKRFSELVDAALAGEPQEITRRGTPAVVVVAFEDYLRLCDSVAGEAPAFLDYLLAIPGGSEDEGLELPVRSRDFMPKAVDL